MRSRADSSVRREALRREVARAAPTRYLDYRTWLGDLYLWTKRALGAYSYVQFSGDIGFGENNVAHLVVRGKRALSLKALSRLCDVLALKGTERQYLELLVRYCNSRKSREREELFERMLALKTRVLASPLEQGQLEYYSEWWHPVVREMVGMAGFSSDPRAIADRVVPRILPEQARKSLELLERLGLVVFDPESGRHVLASRNVTTGDEVAGHAIVRYHQKTIEIAREAITRVEPERRDVSAITVSVGEATAARMKEEIQSFRKHLLSIAEKDEDADQIYQVNIQLFPFTKGGGK